MGTVADVEELVRTRLRSLRTTLGFSLDELAERTNLLLESIEVSELLKKLAEHHSEELSLRGVCRPLDSS